MIDIILDIAELPILERGVFIRQIKGLRGQNVAAYVQNRILKITAGDTRILRQNRAQHRHREACRRRAMADRTAMQRLWGEHA